MAYKLVDIDPFSPDDAQRVADMFNDFDTAWPGGFNRGITETVATVQQYLGRARRVAICAVESDGEFVGYCDLVPFPGDPDRAYVDLLGARLAHHGRGVGKMLLLEMVRRACDLGCRQLSLHTWPGNTKAVPLYKRTGFQWEPDTDVHMQNYMPTILAMPVAKAFFAGADWHACHERDVALVPDDGKWHGMPAYEYRFRKGDEYLNVWIDRASECVAAVETPRFLAGCGIPVEEAAAGESCPIEWTLESRGERPVGVTIAAHPADDLQLDLHERFDLDGSVTVRRDFRIAASARPDRRGDAPHRVRTSVLVDGDSLDLEAGVKVTRPVDVSLDGCGLRAGRSELLRVTLRSRVDRDLRGSLTLVGHPSLACDEPVAAFELPARSWCEHRFPVVAKAAGVHVACLRVESGAVSLDREVHVRALSGAGALVSIDPDDEKAVLESPSLRVEADLRGGNVLVFASGTDRRLAGARAAQVGPPFSGYRIRPDMYGARVEAPDGVPTLVLSRHSNEIEGIVVERRIALDAGHVVRLEDRVANSSSLPRAVSLRLGVESWLAGDVTYPLEGGLVREPFHGWGYFPHSSVDVLPVDGRMAESWCACEERGQVAGAVWSGADEELLAWGGLLPALTYDLGEVPAFGAAAAPPVWVVAGAGTWEVVREWWRRTVSPAGQWEESPPATRRVLDVRTDPSPAILGPGAGTIRVEASSLRGQALSGTLSLQAVPGGDLTVEPPSLALPDLDRDRPFAAEVSVRGREGTWAAVVRATANMAGQELRTDLPVIRLCGAGAVAVREADGVVEVDNGAMSYRVAPAFGGAITSLAYEGAERLRSSYPTAQPFMWAGHWYGGIHPTMGWIGASHLVRETFSGGPCERIAADGALWRGARVACEPTHRDRRWFRIEAEYLTLPGSNALLVLLRLINRTGATLKPDHDPCLAAWLAPGGESGTEAHWMRGGRREVQRVGTFSRDMRSESWAAVADPAAGTATMLVPASRTARAYVEDFADRGQHLGLWAPLTLRPGETRESAAWLVFCRADELAAYGALRDAWPGSDTPASG